MFRHMLFEWLWRLSRVYFWTVHVVFALINRCFFGRNSVPPITNAVLLTSATQLARKIRDREIECFQLTSVEVVQAFIQRIQLVNESINAAVELNFTDALAAAAAVDSMADDERVGRPLLGVPFTLKDCIAVNGLLCTAGIPCRRGVRATTDARVVQRMREAGAIVLAVTNVSEVCMWLESNNSIYGRSRNPYDFRRIVGGSSGGEGALVSAGGSVVGLGSDIGGSIRLPCYFNGIFGHKTSSFIVSEDGCIPKTSGYQANMCTPGPMCRYAEDLTTMMTVLAEPNELVKLHLDRQVDVQKIKVYYMEGLQFGMINSLQKEQLNALKRCVHYLESKRGLWCHRVDLRRLHRFLPIWLNDMHDPAASSFAEEMTDGHGEVNVFLESLKALVGRSVHTIPALGLALIEKMEPVGEAERQMVIDRRERTRAQLEALLEDNAVLLFPTFPVLAPFHNEPVLSPFDFIYTGIFNSLTVPVTQVPIGLTSDGVPTGIQVIGSQFNDRLTIAIAKELEEGFGGWLNFDDSSVIN